MYITASPLERVHDFAVLGPALLNVPSLADRSLPACMAIETGDHRLLDNGKRINTASIGFHMLHSVYLDTTLEKSRPIEPTHVAVCVSETRRAPYGASGNAILQYLIKSASSGHGDDYFDLHAFGQPEVSATVIMPNAVFGPEDDAIKSSREGMLALTRSHIHRLAAVSLAYAVETTAQTRDNITRLAQPTPSPIAEPKHTDERSLLLVPHYYYGMQIGDVGVAMVAARQFTPAEFGRITTPLVRG